MSGFDVGELILSSKPYAYVLSNEFRGQFCDYCFQKKSDLKRCSQCSFLYFCDKNCQSKAWEVHKTECKFLKKSGNKIPAPSLRLMTLIILKIKKYGEEKPIEEVYGRKVSFSTLMSHAEDMKSDLKQCQTMMAMLITLKEYIGSENIPPSAKFTEIFGKMVVNSFSICYEMTTQIGVGLYLKASIFDHSCDPEAVAIFDGTDLNVRMIKGVLHRDISKVHLSYLYQLQLKQDRQNQLKEQYFFKCNCSDCISSKNEELMTKLINDDAEANEISLKCQQELEKLNQMMKDKKNPQLIYDACKELLKIENNVMADTNIYKLKTLEIAFDNCKQLQLWKDALIFATSIEKSTRLFFGKNHPSLGLLLFEIGKILHFLERSREALPKLTEAENILKITHGEQHPLTKKLQRTLQEARFCSGIHNSVSN